MIDSFVQPKNIVVADDLQLVKYYPRYKQTLEWYQDLDVCKQVDNIDFPYDLARLKAMYNALAKGGECYYIKVKDNGKWRLVGGYIPFQRRDMHSDLQAISKSPLWQACGCGDA